MGGGEWRTYCENYFVDVEGQWPSSQLSRHTNRVHWIVQRLIVSAPYPLELV